jgi:rod shape determining protein RodA
MSVLRDFPGLRNSSGRGSSSGLRDGTSLGAGKPTVGLKLPPVTLDGRDAPGRFRARDRLPQRLLRRLAGRNSPLRHLDWVLLAAAVGLSLLGTLLVYSATEPQPGVDAKSYVIKQLVAIVLGLTLMVAVSMLGYRQLRLYAPVAYGLSILGLLAVLSPLGSTIQGGKEWLLLPAGFSVEPSEFAKLGIILMCAMILSELRSSRTRPGLRAVALAAAVVLVPTALVVAEPDLGETVLMLSLLAGLIALSGIRLRWLLAMAVVAAGGVAAVLKLHLLKSYQSGRLTSFLHPAADPTGTGYSAHQALIAVGSGGLYGQGLFHGTLINGVFLGPEQQSDFIFAAAGEQLGFIGTAVIIGLLAVVLLRALRIAQRADDQFGMLVASGVAIWFAVQAFINIGQTVGIAPVTGIPLPFLSAGGSAMLIDMIAVGALQAVHRRRSVFSE